MTDPNLLEQARAAGRVLADTEHHALLARADYHTAIRRLHLGGASLRDIAEALALSHQRVQQIVNAAGGSWWQVWKRRRLTRDTVCTWCERPPSEVAKLIAGPAVFICDDCTADAERVVSGARKHRADLSAAGAGSRARCSFCRKRPDAARTVVVGPANVCADCLRVCREILDSRR